jgi:hypothetical protein
MNRGRIPISLQMVMVYDGRAFVWEDSDDCEEKMIPNLWQTDSYRFNDFSADIQRHQDQQWHLAQELSNAKHQGALARLAAAFCPDGHGIDLLHLTSVSVMEVDEKHLDIQTVICDDMGCVTVQVPIEFPEMCSNVYDEECILHQLEELDHIAEAMLQKRHDDQEKDNARTEWLQQLQSSDDDDYPSWWTNSFWLAEDCLFMRRLLDGPDFTEEVKALAYAALPPDVCDWIVDHVVIRQVGPAGILMRALILKYDFGVEDNEAKLINLSLRYDSVVDSVEGLRREVLNLVASTMETPFDADDELNDSTESEGYNDQFSENPELSSVFEVCQHNIGEQFSGHHDKVHDDLDVAEVPEDFNDMQSFQNSILKEHESSKRDLSDDMRLIDSFNPEKILDETHAHTMQVDSKGMEGFKNSILKDTQRSNPSDSGIDVIVEKSSMHQLNNKVQVDIENDEVPGDVSETEYFKNSLVDETELSDTDLFGNLSTLNERVSDKMLNDIVAHNLQVESIVNLDFHNSISEDSQISNLSDESNILIDDQILNNDPLADTVTKENLGNMMKTVYLKSLIVETAKADDNNDFRGDTHSLNMLHLSENDAEETSDEYDKSSFASEESMPLKSEDNTFPSMNNSDSSLHHDGSGNDDIHIQRISLSHPCKVTSKVTKDLDCLKVQSNESKSGVDS